MSEDINWEKIHEKPEREHKASGIFLLQQKKTIEDQELKIEELNKTIFNLNNEIEQQKVDLGSRNNKIKEMATQTIPNLNEQIINLKKMVDEKVQLEKEFAEILELVEDFKENAKLKDEILGEKNSKIDELMGGIKKHQDRVQELEKLIETLPTIDEMEGLNEFTKNQEKEISSLRDEIAKSNEEITRLKQEIAARPPEPEITPEELEELRKRPSKEEKDKLLKEIDNFKKELEDNEKVNEALKDKIADMHEEITKLKEEGSKPAPIQPTVKPQIVETPLRSPSSYVSQNLGFGGIKTSSPSKIHPSRLKNQETIDKDIIGAPSSGVTTSKSALNPKVEALIDNVKKAITGGIVAHGLAQLLEDTRDEIASIIGFKIVLNEIGNIARKLKKAPADAQIDEESQKIFLSKIDEWADRMR